MECKNCGKEIVYNPDDDRKDNEVDEEFCSEECKEEYMAKVLLIATIS